jgi:surfactin synthase thioesterase subunit
MAIQYPGRQGAADSEHIDGIPELAERIAARLPPPDGRPLAVLGHSMGSVVAFELTRQLEQLGIAPMRLFVSGRRAPAAGLGIDVPQNDEEIIEELRTLGGVPLKLLDRPKYRASILAVIRNDYRMNSGYAVAPGTAVNCPVTFLLSDADPYVDRSAALGWRPHTTGEFRVAEFRGGHFFINDQLAEVTRTLADDLGTRHRNGGPR